MNRKNHNTQSQLRAKTRKSQRVNLHQPPVKEKTRRRFPVEILFAVAVALSAVYIAGFSFYSTHFYSRGSIFGIAMANRTVDDLEKEIERKIASWHLDVETRDGTETISSENVSLTLEDQGIVSRLMEEQNPFLWFLFPATADETIQIRLTIDEKSLKETMDSMDCFQDMQPPANASLKYKDGSFEIVPEKEGNQLRINKTRKVIRNALRTGKSSVSLDDKGCYAAPEITRESEELLAQQEKMNRLLDVKITFDFSDRKEVVKRDEISKWVTADENGSCDLDRDKVWDYVHELGLKYDTFGLSRKFKTHSGDTITLQGGDYGWCIDKDRTTDRLIELIKAGKDATLEPIYLYEGVCRDRNDIGDTYVEISIADQTLWLYVDGECLLSSPVVTGNTSRGMGTPSGGVWSIDERVSPATLDGEGYSNDVTYWLPFNGDIGLHDATWRKSFGGSIYKYNGSHGCVNLPCDAAETVYRHMQIGYPVVVY